MDVRRFAIALVSGLLLPVCGAAAQPYRWVDPQGNVHYSDQPPPSQQETPATRQPQQTPPAPAPPVQPPAMPPRATPPVASIDLGTLWDAEVQGGWTGVWTRRGTSSVFDAVWTQG